MFLIFVHFLMGSFSPLSPHLADQVLRAGGKITPNHGEFLTSQLLSLAPLYLSFSLSDSLSIYLSLYVASHIIWLSHFLSISLSSLSPLYLSFSLNDSLCLFFLSLSLSFYLCSSLSQSLSLSFPFPCISKQVFTLFSTLYYYNSSLLFFSS